MNVLLASVKKVIVKKARSIYRALDKVLPKTKHPIAITFTGGMGAQIISAAIYFHLRDKGSTVYADLNYFNREPYRAKEGVKGDISHWDWQLQNFGLSPHSFQSIPEELQGKCKLIVDGPKKLIMGIEALKREIISEKFIDEGIESCLREYLPFEFLPRYLCIHIRRGDYLNVASHLVDDKDFLDLAKKLSGHFEFVSVVSDSSISEMIKREIQKIYKKAIFLDDVDAVTSHRVMRGASGLLCSNSQFSIVVAILNKKALVFIPAKWYSEDEIELEKSISEICKFKVL